mgnify:FL=1
MCKVVTEKGYVTDCPIIKLSPLQLSDSLVKMVEFQSVSTIQYPLHVKVIYSMLKDDNDYYLQGHLYGDRSIWTFKDFTIYYFHQLQNLLKIRSPGVDLNLF